MIVDMPRMVLIETVAVISNQTVSIGISIERTVKDLILSLFKHVCWNIKPFNLQNFFYVLVVLD